MEIGEERLRKQCWLLESYKLRLVSCKRMKQEPGFKTKPRCLVDDFLLFAETPSLAWTEKDGERVMAPGELLAVPAGMRHRFSEAPGERGASHLIVHALADSQLCANPWKLFNSSFHSLEEPAPWSEKLDWLIALGKLSQGAAAEAGAALLTELLLELFAKEDVQLELPVCDERVRRALDLATERFMDGLTVPEMARAAGLGETRFRKLFKEQTGQSPKKRLEELRMRKACELLRSGLGTGETAKKLGFSGEWHFCAAFKSFSGQTPSAFKRQKDS